MSYTVIIPARYASTRLPGKPLADIHGQPLIAHVARRSNQSEANRVIVATDDERVADVLKAHDCEVCMTSADHQSGSDRLAEVVATLAIADDEIVVNVQGDEPAIPPQLINDVAACLERAPQAAMATAAKVLESRRDFVDPNVVKVVFDQAGRALYFSRAPIPWPRDASGDEERVTGAWHHIGIYAYRAGFLRRYTELQPSALEQAESLEQLRVMDNGEAIYVHPIDYDAGIGVDTEEDLQRARRLLENQVW